MSNWRTAYSIDQLRAELNAEHPHRDKSSDGAIGDTSHASSASDHNPNAHGVVCAFDIDVDLDGTNDNDGGVAIAQLVERMRTRPHPDVKYVIFNRRMFSRYPAHGVPPFTWRAYGGADPHTSHVHVSVGVGSDGHSEQPYDDRDSWGVADVAPLPKPKPPEPEDDDVRVQAIFTVAAPHPDAGTHVLGHHGEHEAVRLLDEEHSAHWQTKLGAPIPLDPLEWDQLVIVEPQGHRK